MIIIAYPLRMNSFEHRCLYICNNRKRDSFIISSSDIYGALNPKRMRFYFSRRIYDFPIIVFNLLSRVSL